ncbi:MAG: type I 3-dehydroquinate dehydratase [Phycisphaerales bacterium]|nr:type I 3-dehydroquinate dehydratase [Phycisphaerales bacterium]
MARVIAPVALLDEAAVAHGLALAARAFEHGADLVEWRLDALPSTQACDLSTLFAAGPCVATCRSEGEGGLFDGSDEDVAAWLDAVASQTPLPSWVDVEYQRWSRSPAVRASAARVREAGPRLLCSMHDFTGRPSDLLRRVSDMSGGPFDAVKVVWRARSLRDIADCRSLLKHATIPMIALCMGEAGLPTRVLAGAWGGMATFAAASSEDATAPGQPTLDALLHQYRFRSLGPDTRLFGLVGDPLGRSPGFELHNAAFAAGGVDAVYLPLPVAAGWESFKATMATLLEDPHLNLGGVSVTLPHKLDAFRFAEEQGAVVSEAAAMCGAVNTLTVGDRLYADNTDVTGVIEPLRDAGATLSGGVAGVIGAGGVARAAAAGLLSEGAAVEVWNRSPDRAEGLVAALRDAGPISVGRSGRRYDVVVQCTPVGMAHGDHPGATPLAALGLDAADILDDHSVLLETIYDPEATPLAQAGRACGASVVTGRQMWLAQAAAQQAAWTGRRPEGW